MATTVRMATFNVENLFRRASALNQGTWQAGKPILEDFSRFNTIIEKPVYTATDSAWLVKALKNYNLHLRDSKKAKFFALNEVRGRLFKVPKGTKTPVITATGRADWVGWLELKKDTITSRAIENTGRVVKAVDADVLAVVEAEDRISLQLFNDQVLAQLKTGYPYNMLIDGNDERGIDVGIFTRFPILSQRSNIDAGLPGSRIFSRDCAEYEIMLPSGDPIWILVNHLKSKGYGSKTGSDAKREAQAGEVAKIYETKHKAHPYVAVVGDFNDTPDSKPLAPLLASTDLKDVMTHPAYTSRPDARPGTFGSGSKSGKLDYILLSPALWKQVKDVDVERRGVWAPRTFPHFPEITKSIEAASDHASVWVDLKL